VQGSHLVNFPGGDQVFLGAEGRVTAIQTYENNEATTREVSSQTENVLSTPPQQSNTFPLELCPSNLQRGLSFALRKDCLRVTVGGTRLVGFFHPLDDDKSVLSGSQPNPAEVMFAMASVTLVCESGIVNGTSLLQNLLVSVDGTVLSLMRTFAKPGGTAFESSLGFANELQSPPPGRRDVYEYTPGGEEKSSGRPYILSPLALRRALAFLLDARFVDITICIRPGKNIVLSLAVESQDMLGEGRNNVPTTGVLALAMTMLAMVRERGVAGALYLLESLNSTLDTDAVAAMMDQVFWRKGDPCK
jgi:hypothetical protein